MSTKAAPVPAASDWSGPSHRLTTAERIYLGCLAAAPVVLVAAVALVGYPLIASIVAASAATAYLGQGRVALGRAGARPVAEGAYPRLVNIVAGVSADVGAPVPRLRVIPSGGPNAMVVRAGGRVVAVTQSLLDGYNRTELEAVIAHCLLRLNGRSWKLSAVAASLGPLGRRLRPWVGDGDDVEAAALTRYPPALAAAILKAEPARGRFAPLYFVADHYSHVDAGRRAEALGDL